jgi:hypothetical protein
LDTDNQKQVLEYGEFIKFMHNAVEWENVLYLAYPYFWDTSANWPFKRFLLHPDPVHREFLRSGAVRVVLTIRPGFEDPFMRLILTGDPQGQPGAASPPYISIGQELHHQDLTNYQNIPPANPDKHARPLLYTLQQNAWNDMQTIIGALEAYNNDQGSYPPGPEPGLPGVLEGVLGKFPPSSFEATLLDRLKALSIDPPGNLAGNTTTFTDPWGNPYHYTTASPGGPLIPGPYELVCYGSNNKPGADLGDPLTEDITSSAEGLLVGQWFEYTPTSALDVSVDSTLPMDGPPLAG